MSRSKSQTGRLSLGLLGLLALSMPVLAQERIDAPRQELPEAAVGQGLPDEPALVVSLNAAKVWRSKAARLLHTCEAFQDAFHEGFSGLGLFPGDIERLSLFQYQREMSILLETRKPLNRAKVIRHLAPRAHNGQLLAGMPYYINEENWLGLVFLSECAVLVGRVDEIESLMKSGFFHQWPAKWPRLYADLGVNLGKRDLVIACQPGKIARLVDQVEPKMRPLMQAHAVVLTADFEAAEMRVKATFACDSDRVAQALEKLLGVLVAEAQESLHQLGAAFAPEKSNRGHPFNLAQEKLCKALASSLKNLKFVREEGTLYGDLMVPARNSLVGLALIPMGGEFSIKVDQCDKLAQAMLDFHRKTGRLPAAAIFSAEGKPLLSWRVALLPYLGQAELFKQFHLDEPWDSEHNRKLIPRMPEAFESDGSPTTDYQVFVGKGAAFEGKTGKRLRDFRDGPEQTILIARAARRVPWTKPEDLHYSADKSLPRLGFQNEVLTVAFADGKVFHVRQGVSLERGQFEKCMRALITRSGADKVEALDLLARCTMLESQAIQRTVFPAPIELPGSGTPYGPYPPVPPGLLPPGIIPPSMIPPSLPQPPKPGN